MLRTTRGSISILESQTKHFIWLQQPWGLKMLPKSGLKYSGSFGGQQISPICSGNALNVAKRLSGEGRVQAGAESAISDSFSAVGLTIETV